MAKLINFRADDHLHTKAAEMAKAVGRDKSAILRILLESTNERQIKQLMARRQGEQLAVHRGA